ncbi:MAG TPA: hypothetical protein VMT21_05140 [Gemmatimonadales bacterium]|nr:hypothetical protein [Gemmatimonadales bacterium]
MTLGQLAVAVDASPRWVLNALARLGLPRRYGEGLARRLALARFISEAARTPLPDALRLADRALREADPGSIWRLEGKGGVSLAVDLPRFFTTYGANLALALNSYGEKPRGRRRSRRGSAIERARAYGVDVSLLDSALRHTPEERVRRVAEDMAFLSEVRGKLR